MNALTLVPALALGAALFVPSAEARDHSSHRGGDRGQSSFSHRGRGDSPRYHSNRNRGDSRSIRGESRRSGYDSHYRSGYRYRPSYRHGYAYRPRYRSYWSVPYYSYSSYYDGCAYYDEDGYYNNNCRDDYPNDYSNYYVAPRPLLRRPHLLRPRVNVRIGF